MTDHVSRSLFIKHCILSDHLLPFLQSCFSHWCEKEGEGSTLLHSFKDSMMVWSYGLVHIITVQDVCGGRAFSRQAGSRGWAYRCIEGYAGSQGHPCVCPSAGSPRITLLFSQIPQTLLISGSAIPDPTTGEST